MQNRFTGSILAAVAAFGLWPAILAPGAEQSETGKAKPSLPDLSGVWDIVRTPDRGRFGQEQPPMQPWAEKKYKVVREGLSDPNERGREELDPNFKCVPPSPARLLTNPHPFEIIQLPVRVILRFEWDRWIREVWTDGRNHPKDLSPTWMGHSIGKWEGDTLVVDTIGVNGLTWLDSSGLPYTDALHMVERIRRRDQETLVIDFWFDDPKAYTKPWSGGQKVYKLKPHWQIAEYVVCEDEVLKRLDLLPSWYVNTRP